MPSRRYLSHTQEFQDLIRQIGGIVSAPVFSNIVKQMYFQTNEVYKDNTCQKVPGILLDFFRYPGVSKDKKVGFGAQGHVQKSRNHSNEEFEVFPLANRKVKVQNAPGNYSGAF